eukprot:gene7252-5099_t
MHRTGTFYDEFDKPPDTELPPIQRSQSARVSHTPATKRPPSPPHDDFFLLPPSKGTPRIVMEPLAVLRQCVRFFSCHPEIYGTNIRALLDREVMQVMRLQSSETALAQQQPVVSSHDMATAVEMISKPLLPTTGGKTEKKRARTDNMLGYGALTFMPMKQNFAALLEKAGEKSGPRIPKADVMEMADVTLDSNPEQMATQGSSSVSFLPIHSVLPGSPDNTMPAPTDPKEQIVLVDVNGYEVSFLRRQLQQMEAAYNAKCIRLHELVEENTRLEAQLRTAEESSENWLNQFREAHSQVDGLRRELEGWQEKAYKAELRGGDTESKQSRSQRRRNTSVADLTRTEVERMTKLWRETEKNLQEAKRSLENSEKEANDTHDHLSDAFMFIERLERRVARRDRYIAVASRRQKSMEEKYEKLLWCMRELGTMVGAHSYVDHLLSNEPIWSLFVFSRLQRHVGDLYSLDESVVPATNDKCLLFGRSNSGGRFMDDRYDTNLVYQLMADEATGLTERRGKTKRLRTNLHGAVGCKVLRWENMYCVDFLGGEDSMPNSTEMNRRRLSLLTLASLILPLRRQNGIRLDVTPPPPPKESKGVVPGKKKEEEPLIIPEDTGVPNSYLYDQATVRLMLRHFWRDRMEQFERTMRQRIEKSITRAQKAIQSRRFNNINDILEAEEPSDDEEYQSETIPNTFLGGLVNWVVKTCTKQGGGGAKDEEANLLLAVRGLPSKDSNLWDDGRLFFASIADAKIRTATVLDGPIPNPPEITLVMREMLCAMYYYTMEYKDLDADFRLFFLVSHQFIPELVGINFYACVEAFQRDCEKLLKENLDANEEETIVQTVQKEVMRQTTTNPFTIIKSEKDPGAMLSPMEAIARTSELIDRAPVVAEAIGQEVDSDEEGYGSILPGSKEKKAAPEEQSGGGAASISSVSQLSSPVSARKSATSGAAPIGSPGPESSGTGLAAEASEAHLSGTNAQHAELFVSGEKVSLGHNILEYLESVKHRRSEFQESEFQKRQQRLEEEATEKRESPLEPWDRLDSEILKIFAPHERITRRFHEGYVVGNFQENRIRRIAFGEVQRKSLAATRGLLPIEDLLMLFHRHCFSTYAITCCGSPRFFFPCAIERETNNPNDYYEPFTRIGMMPPLSIHLQRLRCALALDQPSTLINCRQLFSTDVNTFTPTHFYDEFLTLTLDYFSQQQNYIMNVILTACSSRHEQYSTEGAEECDGRVPMSALKKGFIKAFSELSISTDQSAAYVEHLQNYHELLRLEDDIKMEQFTDAPFFMDSAAVDNEDEEETEWQFEDEAADCSLLFLSLAVRMTYPVWSFNSAVQARKLADVLEKWTPVTKIGQSKSLVPSIIQVQAPATPFEEDVQHSYVVAARHLTEGNSGNYNPLRVTARWMAEEQRVREEANLGHSNPEAYEYHFEPPLERQLENGAYPNWHILRQVLTKAWKLVSTPEGAKQRKGKQPHPPPRRRSAPQLEAGKDKQLAGTSPRDRKDREKDKDGEEKKDKQAELPAVEPTPIRDVGLFVLSRALGTSRNYALRGNTGARNAKKHFVLPFGIELQMQFQQLHFRNSLAMLQSSRQLMQTFLKPVTTTPKRLSITHVEPTIGRHRRVSGERPTVSMAPRTSLVFGPLKMVPSFRVDQGSAVMPGYTTKMPIGRNRKLQQDEASHLYRHLAIGWGPRAGARRLFFSIGLFFPLHHQCGLYYKQFTYHYFFLFFLCGSITNTGHYEQNASISHGTLHTVGRLIVKRSRDVLHDLDGTKMGVHLCVCLPRQPNAIKIFDSPQQHRSIDSFESAGRILRFSLRSGRMAELLTISLEDWLRWRQKMELLAYKDGTVPLEDIMKHIDKLDQKFNHTSASSHSSTRSDSAHIRRRAELPRPAMADASTQVCTVRQGFLSRHVLHSIKHRLSVSALCYEVGYLGDMVATLSRDLLQVLALWLSGSSAVLEPRRSTSASSSKRSCSPTVDMLPEMEAESILESPSAILTTLNRATCASLVAHLPTHIRDEFPPGEVYNPSSAYSSLAEERLAGVLTAWGSLRQQRTRVYSSPILRSGWVCRVCRQDARKMYAYDASNRRLDHVAEEECGGTQTHPKAPQVNHPSRSSSHAGARRRTSRLVTPRSSPQRQLCIGFSKTLTSVSPAQATLLFGGTLTQPSSPSLEEQTISGKTIPSKALKGKRPQLMYVIDDAPCRYNIGSGLPGRCGSCSLVPFRIGFFSLPHIRSSKSAQEKQGQSTTIVLQLLKLFGWPVQMVLPRSKVSCFLSLLFCKHSMAPATARAVVHFGDKFVEIDDPAVTLEDVCTALGVALERGVCVKAREGGRIIATLPFETIVRPKVRQQEDEDSENSDDDDDAEEYELVRSSSLPGEKAPAANAADPVSAYLRNIVDIGAVELLSSPSAQQLVAAERYKPQESPFFLRRTIYLSSVYSPHRSQRDTLAGPQAPVDLLGRKRDRASRDLWGGPLRRAAAAAATGAGRHPSNATLDHRNSFGFDEQQKQIRNAFCAAYLSTPFSGP